MGGITTSAFCQTRHTYVCWQLTAHGNIAFIAGQMGRSDYSMLVNTYGWLRKVSGSPLVMEKSGHNAPKMPQNTPSITESTEINDYKRPEQTYSHDAAVSPDQTATSGASGFLPDG